MNKAQKVIKLLMPYNEAAMSTSDFKSNLEDLISSPSKHGGGKLEYYFKLSSVVQHRDAFKTLCDNISDLVSSNHTANGMLINASVNGEENREHHGYLWDAEANIQGENILISGNGAPSGGDGSATVAYDGKGSGVKVVKDNLKDIHIDLKGAELYDIYIDSCSDALYDLLLGAFGPTGSPSK